MDCEILTFKKKNLTQMKEISIAEKDTNTKPPPAKTGQQAKSPRTETKTQDQAPKQDPDPHPALKPKHQANLTAGYS
jgi:hypothetical protein